MRNQMNEGILQTMTEPQKQQTKKRIVDTVRNANTVEAAARHAKVSPRTVSRWRTADRAFDQQITQALTKRARNTAPDSRIEDARTDAMTSQDALRQLEELLHQAETSGALDVDLSDMDGPTE